MYLSDMISVQIRTVIHLTRPALIILYTWWSWGKHYYKYTILTMEHNMTQSNLPNAVQVIFISGSYFYSPYMEIQLNANLSLNMSIAFHGQAYTIWRRLGICLRHWNSCEAVKPITVAFYIKAVFFSAFHHFQLPLPLFSHTRKLN